MRCEFPDLRSAVHHKEGGLYEHPLHRDQKQCAGKGDAEGPGQDTGTFLTVSPAIGLGRKSAGTDTQKAEVPVQKVEKHRPDGDASDHDSRTAVKMACHSYVHHTDQRNGDVGQNARKSQFQYVLVDRSHYLYLPSSSSMPRYEEYLS